MGKTAIVTGGYSGIGLETTRALAEAGVTVIMPARTPKRPARRDGRCVCLALSLSRWITIDPASVDAFSQRFLHSGRALHYLINNAGIMAAPLVREARGYESQFAANHPGARFQLTLRLWPTSKRAGRGGGARKGRLCRSPQPACACGAVDFD